MHLRSFLFPNGIVIPAQKKHYFIRLLVMTLITQISYVLFHTYDISHTIAFDFKMFLTNWNVIATLLLGFISIAIWGSSKHPVLKVAGIILCCVTGYFTEWSFLGVLFILLFYIFREHS